MKKYLFLIIIILFSINIVEAKETVKYAACVDGDTFKVILNNEKITVRMLAVDTPETAKENKPADYYAEEASDYTCNRLKEARKIVLEYDAKSDKTDKYGRYLAWVFIDNELLQKELVSKGYAKVAYLYDEYKYVDELKKLQEVASANEIGIWNTEAAFNYDASSSKEIIAEEDTDKIENIEVVIISILFLIIIFIAKKIFK